MKSEIKPRHKRTAYRSGSGGRSGTLPAVRNAHSPSSSRSMADTNSRLDTAPGTDAPAASIPSGTEKGTGARDAGSLPKEIGGRDGPEPTRFGDWEKAGRCIDF